MGDTAQLTASDGHKLAAYRAAPPGQAKGGLVIAQEIFGINGHIRRVCDRYAADGFEVVAPALFDRIEHGVELDYSDASIQKGRALRGQLKDDDLVRDVSAAAASLQAARAAVVGYCFGGYVAWVAAGQVDGLSAAVCYYGGGIAGKKALQPQCPVQMHFGDRDGAIPLSDVAAIQAEHPKIPIFVYDGAGHGFCCDERASFDADACERARRRTLAFLDDHLG